MNPQMAPAARPALNRMAPVAGTGDTVPGMNRMQPPATGTGGASVTAGPVGAKGTASGAAGTFDAENPFASVPAANFDVGNPFGDAPKASVANTTDSGAGLPGLWTGGDMDAFATAMTNELGPEGFLDAQTGKVAPIGDGSPGVFTPTHPGAVIPADAFAGIGESASPPPTETSATSGAAARMAALRPTPPNSWENNRWAQATAKTRQMADFYKANPAAAVQRNQEALDAQNAADGINTFRGPSGPLRTMNNRYGTGFSSPMTVDSPHRVADEKGEVDVHALLSGDGGLHPLDSATPYQKDPLADTPWGTTSGIQPAVEPAANLDRVITGASRAAQSWPEEIANAGKPSVAQQFADYQLDHPLAAFDDPTVGHDYAAAFGGGPAGAGSGSVMPDSGPSGYEQRRQMLYGNSSPGAASAMRRLMRTPEGAALTMQHQLGLEKMQHEAEIWDKRTQSSEDRADRRNDTTLQRQAMADESHEARNDARARAQMDHDRQLMQARHGDDVAIEMSKLESARAIGEGLVKQGVIAPELWDSIKGVRDGGILQKELESYRKIYFDKQKASNGSASPKPILQTNRATGKYDGIVDPKTGVVWPLRASTEADGPYPGVGGSAAGAGAPADAAGGMGGYFNRRRK